MPTAEEQSGKNPVRSRHDPASSAGEVHPVSAGFIGSLADTPLAEVLRRIVQEERSGDLQVTTPDAIKTVYFDRGFVVFAASNLKSDRLGESMIAAGRISRPEFARASLVVKSTGQKFGRVLVQSGVVSEEELGHHVATQVNRIVLSLFSAKRGMYSFDERKTVVPLDLMVSLSVYRILMEGIRRMSSKRLVLAGLPPLDTTVRIVDQPPFSVDLGKLREVEKSVLRHARGGASLARIAEVIGGDNGVALRAGYGLLCGGILEMVTIDGSSRRPLQVQEETGTFVLSEIRARAGANEVDERQGAPLPAATAPARDVSSPPLEQEWRLPQPIASDAPSPPRPTLFDWLRRLWETLRSWFTGPAHEEPPRVRRAERSFVPAPPSPVVAPPSPRVVEPVKPEPPAATTVETVGIPSWSLRDESEIDEASSNLSLGVPSWSMRDDPAATVVESSDDPPDESHPERPPVETLGVPSWSMKDDPAEMNPPRPAAKPAARDRKVEPDSEPRRQSWWINEASGLADPTVVDAPESLAEMDTDLFVEADVTGEEASMLSHIPVEEVEVVDEGVEILIEVEESTSEPEGDIEEPPEPRKELERNRQFAPEAPTPAASEAEPAADRRGPDREQVMLRMKQSGGESRLLRDVKLHFKLRDWEGAVSLLEQLIEISPGKALYRGMLARALSGHPLRRKEAEAHFIEALRLSPQDPEIHYWLGLYYKAFGLDARALTEFRTTLRINPSHEGARKQLSASGKKEDPFGSVIKKLFG